MTELDHSFPAALLADLDRHKGSAFHFKYRDDGTLSLSWRLKSAAIVETGVVHIRIEYALSGEDEFSLRLSNGWLFKSGIPMTVVLEGGPLRGSSVDNSRQRLDDNLRGVFA